MQRFLTVTLFLLATSPLAVAEPPFLRMSMENEPITLDWQRTRSEQERFILSFLMRGMMRYDDSGSLVCDLCDSYDVQDQGKAYTFQLQKNVRWVDQKKLTGQHFVDGFARLRDSRQKFPSAEKFDFISRVHSPKSDQVIFNLSQTSALLLHLLTTPASYPIRKKQTGSKMASLTLGPYILAAWEKRKRIVLEANPLFTESRPAYRVEFIYGSHQDLLALFKKGKLDVLADPTTLEILANKKDKFQAHPYWATRYLTFNLRREMTGNLSFRKSILSGTNRKLLPGVVSNGARPTTGILPPGIPGHRRLSLSTYDLTQARAERNRAHPWPKTIDLDLLYPNDFASQSAAEWIRDQLAEIHIRLRLVKRNSADYFRSLEIGDFDLALMKWTFQFASPLDLLESFKSNRRMNYGGWADVAYDTLLERALQETDTQKQDLQTGQMLQILEQKRIAAVALSYPARTFLLSYRVQHFPVTPYGDPDLIRIQLKQ